jgi:SAM-dependent methyltransferase/tetratricopeptide (TPR) repeat protein
MSMNRRERRAATALAKATRAAAADIERLTADAQRAYQNGQIQNAEAICEQILAREPAHVASLNLVGLIKQAAGRHRLAIKMFARAVVADDLAAACHYNIALSYQALDERAAAARHYKTAIGLGMGDLSVEEFVRRRPVIVEFAKRMSDRPLPSGKSEKLFGIGDIAAVANDILVLCALETTILRCPILELILTRLRSAMLQLARADVPTARANDDTVAVLSALAQQCYLNEYVYAQGDEEALQADQLRELLQQKISAAEGISPLLLAAVGAYYPLNSIASAASLLAAEWPDCTADLLRLQVREPSEEAEERRVIPALTSVGDGVSLQVMQQYEENPYPRWALNPYAVRAGDMKKHAAAGARTGLAIEVLIAGCGTGKHPIAIAQASPEMRILAVDISRASLAYARRKSREEGVQSIEYAQADIMQMGAIGRTFDRIEAGGVLHHLADPKAGWRVLLSLLRPTGTMRIGLYSETARRVFADARALIAECGYRATAHDIRTFRQTVVQNRNNQRWTTLIQTRDFYNMSGCRDLLFNVMEHRFTIPEIAAFLKDEGLSFLGFELDATVVEKFQRKFPGPDALTNLEFWDAFETANPDTFLQMYMFSVCRNDRMREIAH